MTMVISAPPPPTLLLEQVDFDCDCAIVSECQTIPMAPFPYPAFYALELTSWCNSHCAGCSNIFAPRSPTSPSCSPPPMSLEQWETVLAMIAPHAARIKLTGGEPTSYPQFAGLLDAIAHYGIPCTVFTNGRWAEPEHTLAPIKNHSDLVRMLVSLHGADAKTHDTFTGVAGSFFQTIQAISQATRMGITVSTSTVLTRENVQQVESIVTLSQSLGAMGAIFNRYIRGPFGPALAPPPSQFRQALLTIKRLKTMGVHARIGTAIPFCFIEVSEQGSEGGSERGSERGSEIGSGCLAGIAACTIDPWGNMRPCNHATTITGHVLTDSLETAWNAIPMASWRASLPQQCQQCARHAGCRGGCTVEAGEGGGDPLIQHSG